MSADETGSNTSAATGQTVPVGVSPEGPLCASNVNSTDCRPTPVTAMPVTES